MPILHALVLVLVLVHESGRAESGTAVNESENVNENVNQSVPKSGPCSALPALEITNVQVIDVRTGHIQSQATLVIEAGRICSIVPAGHNRTAARDRIDGRGRFVLPGLRWGARDAVESRRLIGQGVTYPGKDSSSADQDLHDTLTRLVQTGHSRLQALQSVALATAHKQRHRRTGQLGPGSEATLILLEANPLEDVANIRSVSLVVLHGQQLGLVELARARAGRSVRFTGDG